MKIKGTIEGVLWQLPGNGKSLIDKDFELNVIMIGEADHFIQMLDIKYTLKTITTKNMAAKNDLSKNTDFLE